MIARLTTRLAIALVSGLLVVPAMGMAHRDEPTARAAEPAADDSSEGTWAQVSCTQQEPCEARRLHTATVLSDGRVLVVGGTGSGKATQVYDPGSGSWTSGGEMNYLRRAGHTATLLDPSGCGQRSDGYPCGQVLVVGGSGGEVSAERYDPGRGWTETAMPPLGTVRDEHDLRVQEGLSGHTATLLDAPGCAAAGRPEWCGKVLVAGAQQRATQLYDPVADSWLPGPPMQEARGGYPAIATATALGDGRVLLVGGNQEPSCAAEKAARSQTKEAGAPQPDVPANPDDCHDGRTAELFDPESGTWTSTGMLPHPTTSETGGDQTPNHRATLLRDGMVLVTGGETLAADLSVTQVSQWAQLYDPEKAPGEDWTAGLMTKPRGRGFSATLLANGKVLVAGGKQGGNDSDTSSEVYDPSTRRWSTAPSLNRSRSEHTATTLGDASVLVVGGESEPAQGEEPGLPTYEIFGAGSRPSVTGLSPASGPITGGTRVRISGSGFAGDVAVRFGDQPALSTKLEAPTLVTAVAPPHAAGEVDVVVTAVAGGTTRRSAAPAAGAQIYAYLPAVGGWAPGGEPAQLRHGHTATLLGGDACARASLPVCGHILVAGGEGVDPRSAELYDPATASWASTGAMTRERAGHTATSLPDGRVLVVGGREADGRGIASTEVYDPATGSWSSGPELTVGRHGHTATSLADGRVLVIGGHTTVLGSPVYLDVVEVYAPAAVPPGSWEPAGRLNHARASHTATLTGTDVLVAGGFGDDGTIASTEVYDPGMALADEREPLGHGRGSHTATLLGDGSVLVAGGTGHGGTAVLPAERWDPDASAWTSSGSVSAGGGHTASLLPSGRVIVAGGRSLGSSTPASASVEIFDPQTGEWAPGLRMLVPRAGHTATVLAGPACAAAGSDNRCGSIVMTGGTDDWPMAEVLDENAPLVPTVAGVDPPAGPTFGGTIVTLTGVGLFGRDLSVRFGATAVPPSGVLFVADDEISVVAPPSAQGTVGVAVVADGRSSRASPAARFTYGSGAWDPPGAPHRAGGDSGCAPRISHTATALADGRVLLAGGTANFTIGHADPLASADLYDPVTGRCTTAGSLAPARFDHTATRLADGSVLVVGGQNRLGEAIDSVQRFVPATLTWEPAGELERARFSHTATLLPDGRVLVAGGSSFEEYRSQATATTEIYTPNPRGGTWSPGPAMVTARVDHTATLTADGTVMAAGGLGAVPEVVPGAVAGTRTSACRSDPRPPENVRQRLCPTGAVPLDSAEVFDPAGAAAWRPTAPLAVARYDHTATVLGAPGCSAASAGAGRPSWCGKVLVSGGGAGGPGGLSSAELYDPVARTWSATGSLARPRGGHTATSLASGRVLAAGSGPRFPGGELGDPVATAEVYAPDSGTWALTAGMATPRAAHSATALPGGDVLLAGGYREQGGNPLVMKPSTPTLEVYTPAPTVAGVAPRAVEAAGGTHVTLNGSGLSRAASVQVGAAPVPEPDVTPRSDTEMGFVAPARDPGRTTVAVVGPGGTSAALAPDPAARLTYLGRPGPVLGLVAEAQAGAGELLLRFLPAAASAGRPELGLARDYEVRQATVPLGDPAAVQDATALCGGLCANLGPQADGAIRLRVTDLAPGTYHYVVRAVNEAGLPGSYSAPVQAELGRAGVRACPALPAPATGVSQVLYPGGRYSLLGLPGGTAVGADSPLYGWFDQGAGGSYTSQPGSTALLGGRGYWAWFACPRLVSAGGGGEEPVLASLPLGGYHASIVGNPYATATATVANHDFAARWDADANGGAGGYHLSSYRQPQTLAVGEGLWVFSYGGATVVVRPL